MFAHPQLSSKHPLFGVVAEHLYLWSVALMCFNYITGGYSTYSVCFNLATFLGRWWRWASVHNQHGRLVKKKKSNHTCRVSSLNHREPAPLLLRWLMRFNSPSTRWRDQLCHHSVKQLERSLWLIWLLTPDVPHLRGCSRIHHKFTGVFSRMGSDGTSLLSYPSTLFMDNCLIPHWYLDFLPL